MKKQKNARLDNRLVELGLAENRSKARAVIMSGAVMVDGRVRDKPGVLVPASARISMKQGPRYASRGGLKLEAALDEFGIDPSNKVCLDVGASTGGFTDCLLQRGAGKVYAVDVGKAQLEWRLRNDPRVVVMEGVNARRLAPGDLPEPVDLAVVDVSFISLDLVIPALSSLVRKGGEAIALVKPQFEAGRRKVQRGGVVKDEKVIAACVDKVSRAALETGLVERGRTPSPVKGPKGNQEWLVWFEKL